MRFLQSLSQKYIASIHRVRQDSLTPLSQMRSSTPPSRPVPKSDSFRATFVVCCLKTSPKANPTSPATSNRATRPQLPKAQWWKKNSSSPAQLGVSYYKAAVAYCWPWWHFPCCWKFTGCEQGAKLLHKLTLQPIIIRWRLLDSTNVVCTHKLHRVELNWVVVYRAVYLVCHGPAHSALCTQYSIAHVLLHILNTWQYM